MGAKYRAEIRRLRKELFDLDLSIRIDDANRGETWEHRTVLKMLRLERHKKQALEIARYYKKQLDAIKDLMDGW